MDNRRLHKKNLRARAEDQKSNGKSVKSEKKKEERLKIPLGSKLSENTINSAEILSNRHLILLCISA